MEYPYIDILVATFNGEDFISEQLDSLLKQTYPNINIIISDDGSKDNTINIINQYIKKYPNKIRLLKNNNKHGINANFDYLLQHHLSNYVMFCDQDDVWFDNKVMITFQKMFECESKYSNNVPLLIFSDKIVSDSNLNQIYKSHMIYEGFAVKDFSLNKLLIQNVISGCTIMINLPAIKLCNTIPNNIIMYDYWIALIVSAFGQIIFLNTPLMLYRQHQNNSVGANKKYFYSVIFKFLQMRIPPFKKRYNANIEQAKIFLNNYKDIISVEQKELLDNFISLSTKNMLTRTYILYKYKMLKDGFINKIKMVY